MASFTIYENIVFGLEMGWLMDMNALNFFYDLVTEHADL